MYDRFVGWLLREAKLTRQTIEIDRGGDAGIADQHIEANGLEQPNAC